MTAMDQQGVQDLLVRIDERVKAIQEDIREINAVRQCATHREKITTLERMVWGCMASLGVIGAKLIHEALQ